MGIKHATSKVLFERAKRSIPGGVNSPVRAFRSVGGEPIFMEHAHGSKIVDADGNVYIDYVGSWGPFIIGHSHPHVTEAIIRQTERATSFGAPTELEIELAERVRTFFPSIELIRMVNSGTEATMSAVRAARGFTGKSKIIKFNGCYHGHADAFLIKAGSGALTLGSPDSPGVTKGAAEDTLVAEYNDIESVRQLAVANRGALAAIIVEPIAGNMGVIPPVEGFLEGLRAICDQEDAVLIFDEVMTGFRVRAGGAQELYGITPDLTTLGKIIGGGLPVGAFGGRKDIMSVISPLGSVYQAGTLSGNPLAMAAGLATLDVISEEGFYQTLEDTSARLANGMNANLAEAGIPSFTTRVGSMMCLFFTAEQVRDYKTATTSDTASYADYFNAMLNQGIYLAPSQYEAMFVSSAHSAEDIDRTLEAQRSSLMSMNAQTISSTSRRNSALR